jgi:GntR family transcriptional repressor for pyruvate dehydrogenase complex
MPRRGSPEVVQPIDHSAVKAYLAPADPAAQAAPPGRRPTDTPVIFSAVSHNRTADAVVDQIEALILDGVLRPGDRLPAERDLSRAFDVSRPILREALADLDRRGLVTARHGGGTFVADVIGEVFREPVVDLVRRHPKAQADYMDFRREIDAVAAGLAAERATAADRAMLARVVDALSTAHAEPDPGREAALDVEFHMAIAECAHNCVLLHTTRACYRLLADGVFYSRSLLYAHADSRDRLFAQHRAIHAAVVAGDAPAARAAAAAHMRYVAEAVAARQAEIEREQIAERRLAASGTRIDTAPRGRRVPAVGAALAGGDGRE